MMAAAKDIQDEPSSELSISSTEEAALLCQDLAKLMDELIATVETETDLVKAGQLLQAGGLAATKANLSRDYTAKMLYLKKNSSLIKHYAPEELDKLQRKHSLFRAILKINLGALGAARAVSAEIMESLAAAVGKQKKTSGYGANAQLPQQSGFVSEGIALDRGI